MTVSIFVKYCAAWGKLLREPDAAFGPPRVKGVHVAAGDVISQQLQIEIGVREIIRRRVSHQGPALNRADPRLKGKGVRAPRQIGLRDLKRDARRKANGFGSSARRAAEALRLKSQAVRESVSPRL